MNRVFAQPVPDNPRMQTRLRTLAVALALIAALALAAPAAAENEWCDDGSPPPNDFGVQRTAVPSVTSDYHWLYSADGGREVYQQWSLGSPDLSVLQRLIGGIIQGMFNALAGRSASPSYVSR